MAGEAEGSKARRSFRPVPMRLDHSLEVFIAAVPPERQSLLATLRRTVQDAIPTASERVYPGWRAIGYRHPVQGYVGGIFPFEAKTLLVFEWGALLADPLHLLGGNGRQARTIALGPDDSVPVAAIQALLRDTLALPPSRAAKLDLLHGRAPRLG